MNGELDNAWTALDAQANTAQSRSILALLDDDRTATYSVRAGDMLFDYSKTAMDDAARTALLGLFDAADVTAKRDAMFAGAVINETEGREVLHTALRNLDGGPVLVDGVDVMPGVLDTLARMEAFAQSVRNEGFTGQGGAITDVVNIGIGGSDLGPAKAVRAL